MNKKEINEYINKLKTGKVRRCDIPKYIIISPEFRDAERKAQIRIPYKRGYDVISNSFFVEELIKNGKTLEYSETIYFESFDSYKSFLSGKIYDNACYFQLNTNEKNIDLKKTKTHFIDETIDDYVFDKFTVDPQEYENIERVKKLLYKWVDKFYQCKNAEQFLSISEKYNKSKCSMIPSDAIFALLFKRDSQKTFNLFMDILNTEYDGNKYALLLSEFFGSQKVLDNYNPRIRNCTKQMVNRKKTEVQGLLKKIISGDYQKRETKGFDSKIHLFFVKTDYYLGIESHFRHRVVVRYFDKFDEFADYLMGDLSDCDLSGAIINADFSNCVSNESTIFPIGGGCIKYEVQKYWDKYFYVRQKWTDNSGNVLDIKSHNFKYFFDFAYFLKYDLSNADFSMCDGIGNLTDISVFKLDGLMARSKVLDHLGVKYKRWPKAKTESFSPVIKNEEETALILEHTREKRLSFDEIYEMNVVAYISDLHLIHKLLNLKCRNDADILFVLNDVANNIKKASSDVTLIGGDVSSDYLLYQQLVELLTEKKHAYSRAERNIKVFVLGNHELWEFPKEDLNCIVEKYRAIITNAGMYLLHNSIIYKTTDGKIHEISQGELKTISVDDLREKLSIAQLIIFGGTGFSGCNNDFNANNGIYRKTITRKQEIQESKIFNGLYEKVCAACYDKNVIIFTHMPKIDWSGNNDTIDNFVYVSGHTHRNYFYDDGITRIYSDNQIGYSKRIHSLKKFYIDKQFDLFSEYEDGVYEISKDAYNNFLRAKNLTVDYNRSDTVMMLKREGYYCFIRKGKKGISILNGGALKKLWIDDINYYYDNMVNEIAFLKKPLDKYMAFQQRLAEQIRFIGGYGRIHGCIVDIDFRNHIYVNPIDFTVTGYFAIDMISKYVYKNVPSLLMDKCPMMYKRYIKLLEGKSENALVVSNNTEIDLKSVYYPETDIYKASRKIKKMQKVNRGILTTWIDPNTGKDLLE